MRTRHPSIRTFEALASLPGPAKWRISHRRQDLLVALQGLESCLPFQAVQKAYEHLQALLVRKSRAS